jgi:hypothetical protein
MVHRHAGPAWSCEWAPIAAHRALAFLVRLVFSLKYGQKFNMDENLRTPRDAVPGTLYAQTRYAPLSGGERPPVAAANCIFLKRGSKIREQRNGRFV